MCEVVHTSVEIIKVLVNANPGLLGNVHASEGVMPRTNLWSRSASRIEIDQRSREARLRFERTDLLFVLSATVRHSWLRGLLYLFTGRIYGGLAKEGGVKEPLGDRWPSHLPMLLGIWLEHAGVCNLPTHFKF